MNKIEDWYDERYDEWERLNQHKIEFDITKIYLDEYERRYEIISTINEQIIEKI